MKLLRKQKQWQREVQSAMSVASSQRVRTALYATIQPHILVSPYPHPACLYLSFVSEPLSSLMTFSFFLACVLSQVKWKPRTHKRRPQRPHRTTTVQINCLPGCSCWRSLLVLCAVSMTTRLITPAFKKDSFRLLVKKYKTYTKMKWPGSFNTLKPIIGIRAHYFF